VERMGVHTGVFHTNLKTMGVDTVGSGDQATAISFKFIPNFLKLNMFKRRSLVSGLFDTLRSPSDLSRPIPPRELIPEMYQLWPFHLRQSFSVYPEISAKPLLSFCL